MANTVAHWEICVKDYKAGLEFYKKIFDWKIEDSPIPGMDYGMISTGAEPGGGIFPAQGDMKPYVCLYIKVDDIDATLDKAEAAGAFIIQRKKLISEEFGYYGMFADPDNNVVGLWSNK